jgi:transposase
MANFIKYDYKQDVMLAINFEEQLQPGTFEYAIHYLIDNKLDLSIFHPKFKNKDTGRPAYDPAILLKIILFAYSKGITSSREIEWCCKTNIIFKALTCDSIPHFTTIADFVSSRSKEIEVLFEQVLLVCYEQGLLGNELFAIDGCKQSSNAAKEWSGTFKELEEKRAKIKRQIKYHLKEHQQLDKNSSRDEERIKRAAQAINTLNNASDKIEQFLKTSAPRIGVSKQKTEVKSNITDNESAKMTTSKGTIQGYNGVATVDKKHQIIIDAQAFGAGQEQHTLKPVIEKIEERYKKLNISDDIYASNVVVTADTGFANEANMKYLHENNINAYIPDNQFRSRDPKFADQKKKYGKRHQNNKKTHLIKQFSPNEFDVDLVNKTCRCPMGKSLVLSEEKVNREGHDTLSFRGQLKDCRECEQVSNCMKNPKSLSKTKSHTRRVSFIIKKAIRKPNHTDWMKERVDSKEGKLYYSHRMSVVEPVFGNIGTNKGLNRFSLRGKEKVNGQWKLFCLIQNIEKLKNYGELAA